MLSLDFQLPIVPAACCLALIPAWGWSQDAPTEPSTPAAPQEAATATTSKKAKQIRVICDDPAAGNSFRIFADNLHSGILQLLGERDDTWVFPLVIEVSGNPQDVVDGATAVTEIKLLFDGTFELKQYVRLHNRYDSQEVSRRFIQLILYEMMVRPYAGGTEQFGGKSLEVPYWLIRGIEELLKHRASGQPSDLFAGIVKSRKVLPVNEILNQKENETLDPVTDAIFGASSAALVATLLDLDQGQQSFRGFLGNLADSRDESVSALLRQSFPALRGSAGALEKWWSLQIATMGQLQAYEYLDAEETAKRLDAALQVHLPAETPKKEGGFRKWLPHMKPKEAFDGRIHDFKKFKDHEKAEAGLEQSRQALQGLGMQGFPLFRGIILRYEQNVLSLLQGKERGVAKELESLDQERQDVSETMKQVEDFLNFYEATQAEGSSEAYEHFREMKDKLEREKRKNRTDRIGKYLDALEREFETP